MPRKKKSSPRPKPDSLDEDLARVTAERDEARRLYCEERYLAERADLRSTPTSPEVIAANRGWDCYDAKEGKP